MDIVLTIVLGVAAGVAAGLLGVGGGVIMVPALTLVLGQSQIEAEATSLLAIVPVAVLGTWRQYRYGNVSLRDGLLIGMMSLAGVAAGTVIANEVPQRALRIAFAGLLVFVAARMVQQGVRPRRSESEPA